ncbi:MAG: hypothetical protein ACREQA_05040 [Candidatus Binatia bacterium]
MAVSAGPGSGSNHPKGMAWVAIEALAHRPRPEDSHPEETDFGGIIFDTGAYQKSYLRIKKATFRPS